MVASLNWITGFPSNMLEPAFRSQQGEQLIDIYAAVPPIYFVKSRSKLRRVTGALRLTFPQRNTFLQQEPYYRGRRFNADFEGLGTTRETLIEDWSLTPVAGGAGFLLNLTLTIFDVGQLETTLHPGSGMAMGAGNAPIVVQF